MLFDDAPIWSIFVGVTALVLLCLQIGVLIGRRHLRSGKPKLEVSGAIVGAAMGLLAFALAFTFNMAASRYDARRGLVVEETNAIGTTWLRAGFLEEPDRSAMRAAVRDYVDVRVNAALGRLDVQEGLRQTDALHDRMWAIAEVVGRRDGTSITTGLLIQALNEVIDVHLKRLSVGLRARIPDTIWATLYLLLIVGMVMMGLQIGQTAARQYALELALAATFALVLYLIADLDRPQQGLVTVSQQAMVELQTKLHKP